MTERTPMFSVTKDDCDIQYFHAGGPGGQNQNKRNTGCRVIHRESGAVGEARDSRSQLENTHSAFKRMAQTPKFKFWVAKIMNEISTGKTSEEIVNEQMKPENLKIEAKDGDGKWMEVKDG